MHTATQLDSSMFAIETDGKPARPDDVFPGWDANDRFGIIATEPQYPEIYAFHVRGPHGDHRLENLTRPDLQVAHGA